MMVCQACEQGGGPQSRYQLPFCHKPFAWILGVGLFFFRFRSCHPYQLGVRGLEWESAGFDTVPSTLSNFSSPVR